ncbi:SDR family oxidoreductase [Bacillus sp. FJAT-42376]|uniref:SDR family NAD(P)-dependent oxidoreductase n=1 Tax=Bacillus sp. FJAT-42376 TaxID=2014076 RepID=UPI000F4D6C98|nr:SDR family oxidoreductase [Bacillus sp. FJAT-42376]AZB42308.1 SDR family oxidoreductase [Bacillus sp. FJAT-42376]
MENKKVAIVTGGASGIGRALCLELSRQGAAVIIADINETEGKKAQAAITGSAFVYCDVKDLRCMEKIIHETYTNYGRIDYLFNNAGVALYGEFSDMNMTHWKKTMDVNVWGVIHGTQIAYAIMKKQGFGHIVNTASAAGLGPSPFSAVYSATKHTVVGLTTSLHYEAEAYGVKVTALCPAFVDTPILNKAEAVKLDKSLIMEQFKKQKMMSPERFAKIALKGVHQNKTIICPMPLRKTMDVFFTLFPAAHSSLMRLVCRVSRKAKVSA